MVRRSMYLLLFYLMGGCVEPYKFVITDIESSLVVEAFISDKSWRETVEYPSDGRYFTAKLSRTGDVTNVRSEPVSFASVVLENDRGASWQYSESSEETGVYSLLDEDFKAEQGVQYKLTVRLPDERTYESTWQALPSASEPPMGEINYQEVQYKKYAIQANKEVIVTVNGIQTLISLPQNNSGTTLFYKWNFYPTWIYIAPLSPSAILPGYRCWVSTPYYLRDYMLQGDNVGGYNKDLFRMETIRNERIFERFSALIVQYAMTKDYFTFWKEMQEQNQDGAILDKPPFNLHTNFREKNDEGKVYGYFGVVHEQARRWYFEKDQLSYFVVNTLKKDCTVPYQDPGPSCFDCREYTFGNPSNVRPAWWVD